MHPSEIPEDYQHKLKLIDMLPLSFQINVVNIIETSDNYKDAEQKIIDYLYLKILMLNGIMGLFKYSGKGQKK